WAKDVTVTVRLGGNPMDTSSVYTVNAKYGDTITLEEPTAEGKTFAGWQDVEGNAVDASFVVEADTAVYATWNITPYTLTIKQDGQEDKVFTFGVEAVGDITLTPADLAYVLEDNLPADTADWDYEWAEEVPETFALQNYTFTVSATYIDYVGFTFVGEAVEVEIPVGKYATGEVYGMGDYTVSWTGDATVTINGSAVENGGVINVANPRMPVTVVITPVDATAACTVTFNMETYVAPLTALEKDNEVTINVEDTWSGVFVEFTAPAAGKYVLKPGADETNAWIDTAYYNDGWGSYDVNWADVREDVLSAYEFEATEAGEKFYFWVNTWDEMPGEVSLIVEEAPEVITTIPEALEAEDGALIEVSGTVCAVNTAWSEQYKNITVTIVDADGNTLYVFRMATNVALGDIITVSGEMATYNNNRQVAAGATAVKTGHDTSYDYEEMTIVEAIAAEDGTNVIVTGTVVEIETAYSEQYKNISVYIADENGVRLYLYRLSGNVEVGQIITVKGAMATYQEARQVTGGTFEVAGTHECSKYTEATCKDPAACVVCGKAKDDVLADHKYVDGVCSVCGGEEPADEPTDEPKDEPTDSTSEPTEEPVAEDEGCGSVIGGVALGAIALAGAAMLIRKKKED
ncbi:MAG: PT domain-containing protein, partial [Clostridia bacterium]|nr:PT domain-containing protein [Clostridia bacterium]